MVKETTNTNNFELPEEGHYPDLEIVKVIRKDIKGFILYEWHFMAPDLTEIEITLFSSQMADLLRALKAEEPTSGKFIWDRDEVVGNHVSLNIVHAPDKKGIIRATITDVVKSDKPKKVIEREWDYDK